MKIKKSQLKELIRQSIFELSEADDDKYIHVGYGRFKQKGKEKDPNSPTFKKTDAGKFVEHTGWKPEIPFEKTMNDLLEYWRSGIKNNGKKYLTR